MATDTFTDLGLEVIRRPGLPAHESGPGRGQETAGPRSARTRIRLARVLEDAVLIAAAGVTATGLLIFSYGMTLLLQGR